MVKNFGAKMVQDHTAANDKLASLAATKKITLPKRPDAKQRAMLKKLGKKSGASFDSAYIKEEIADHKATVALMQREISSGKDADAKAFASETLPVVKEQLGMLQNMKSGSGMHSNTGSDRHSDSHMDSMGGTPSSSTHGSTPRARPHPIRTRFQALLQPGHRADLHLVPNNCWIRVSLLKRVNPNAISS